MALIDFEAPSDPPNRNLEVWRQNDTYIFNVDGEISNITATSGDHDVNGDGEYTVFLQRDGKPFAEADVYVAREGAGIDRLIPIEGGDEDVELFIRFVAATVRDAYPTIQYVEYDEENIL